MQFSTTLSRPCRRNLPLSLTHSLSIQECVSTVAQLERMPRREWHCAILHWALCGFWHTEIIPRHSALVQQRRFQWRLSPCRNVTVARIVWEFLFSSDQLRLLAPSHWRMWKEHFYKKLLTGDSNPPGGQLQALSDFGWNPSETLPNLSSVSDG